IFIPLIVPQIRRDIIAKQILKFFRGVMPKLSLTERQAINVGTAEWAGDLFSGMPNWQKFLEKSPFKLSPEEQAFLDGPTEQLCSMINDWDITHNLADMPPELWKFIKEQGFFALIIPKRYGGKEFSAAAHSAIITKVGSCSITVASTVAVPNS